MASGTAIVQKGGVLDTGISINATTADVGANTFTNLLNTTTGVAGGTGVKGDGGDNSGQDTAPLMPGTTTLEQMQAVYLDKLGREGIPENVMNWVNAVNAGQMTFDEAVAGIAGSEEGLAFAASGVPAGSQTTTTTDVSPNDPNHGPNIMAAIDIINSNLGTAEEYAAYFGISLDEFNALTDQYGGYTDPNAANGTNDTVTGGTGEVISDGGTNNDTINGGVNNDTITGGVSSSTGTTATPTTDFSPLIQQYYQELFNRQARQPGLDYFTGRLTSGALTEDALRDAIIAGATGTDKLYYDSSQAYGPVFDATYSLFGRRPARGRFNPETGQLEGGFGQYRSRIDAGQLTEDQLRRNLVDLAYRRGEGGGRSGDYQYYLNTLGIDRADNPFLQDDGTYRNIPYGMNLAEYQQDTGMPPPPPSGGDVMDDVPFPGGGFPPVPPNIPGGGLGKGGGMGRIPGQYITGNQLYSGLPFGMTQPMGMMNFMQPMMQPTIYQPPQLSQQYMPNRGLMSGYSTGFGPYGGDRRPRFGGGKGGPIYRPMGGKGGFGF